MNRMPISEKAQTLLEARYLKRNRDGDTVETPEEMFARTAAAVSEPELLYGTPSDARQRYAEFHRAMINREFLPNSPTLMNAGTAMNQLSACFVLPVYDSLEDIFDAVRNMAVIQRSGGGVGFSFSRLRPKGDFIAATGGAASGPVSFMEIFDCATANVRQGGRRRGANIGVLRVDHPDILDFVHAKSREGAFENFNLSVLVDDAFMNAVVKDADYELRHPRNGRAAGKRKAREVFDAVCRAAWENGDPGLVFADAVHAANPLPDLGRIAAVNPCGEVPLLDNEACNLGSVNLDRMLHDGDGSVDWEKLKKTVETGVRFLDNVIDACRYPLRAVEKMSRGNRKIGLGVMGFADMLIRLGIPYDSDDGVDLAARIMEAVSAQAFRVSVRLAEERGVHPNWKRSVHFKQNQPLRNATRTAVAPTGSISMIAETAPSIEPLFALVYRRTNILQGETFYEVQPLFREVAARKGLDPDRIAKRVRQKGSLNALAEVPDDIKRLFCTALEIAPERHLRVQQAFQRCTDNSVSKTVNMPEDAAPGDVAEVYRRAWEMGLKGITVFRSGSRSAQVFELPSDEEVCEACAG